MATDLTNVAVSTGFVQLLHIDGGVGGSATRVYDGDGTGTPLEISTTEVVIKDGSFNLDVASHDGTNGLKLGGTLVTTSAAELNLLDGITAGTVSASKFLIVDSNKDLTGLRNLTATGTITAANFTGTGNTQIGDAAADTVAMNATITTNLIFEGSTDNAYETTLAITDPTADRTWTIPDATDTSVGRATTDTLTNKTLTAPDINTPDIDGGTVDAITSLTVANSVDIGNYTLTANGLTIDGTFTDGTLSVASGSIASAVNGTFSGTVQAEQLTTTDDLTVSGLATIGETLAVTGVATFTAQSVHNGGLSTGALVMNDGSITDTSGTISLGDENLTTTGVGTFASLDISGNADIDGTMEADAYTVDGTTLAEYIADTAGAMVSSNTESGITVTYQDGDNTVDLSVDAAQTGITSIYATDLIMGEDSQTAIDFGTANEIDFKADNAARLTLTASALYPVTDNQIDLGTASLEFKDAFFDGTVTSDAFAGPLTGNVAGDLTGTIQTAAQTNITSLGTLTALTVDDVAINGKVLTMTGSSSDTAVFTVGTNGTLSVVTTDDAAAAANIQITADGTVDIDSAGVLTLDSGAAINLEPASGSAILLDGTISVDAGVVTGATSITSTAFVGNLTGTASKATVTDSTANTNFPVVFHDESDALLDDTGALRYNPSTGELLVPKLTVAGTTTTVDTVTMNAANAIIFEGATADAHETTLSIVDPTSDNTQYLINQGGYIPVLAAATTTAITSTPAELNILDGVTSTAAELNLIDGGTARGTTAVASGDGILINDGGTMRMTNVDTVSTYFSSHNVGGGNIVTTGALNSGSITSGFGTIDTGSSTITTTGVVSAGGFTIGSAVIAEAELEMIDGITAGTAAASKAVVLDGSKNIATLGTIGSGAITATGSSSFATSIKTPLIEYTDGDDAITIADGGGITAANGITSTAAANTFGTTSFNDANITNVGDISLDSISSDAGTSINVVLGSDAGDDFTVDTSKLVVEGDNGFIGIGEVTPQKALHITKTDDCIIILDGNGTSTDKHIVMAHEYGASSGHHWSMGVDQSANSGAGQFVIAYDANSQASFTDDDFFNITSTGLVGINTASPETAIHITSTGGGVGSAIMLEDSNASTDQKKIRFYTGSQKAYFDIPNDAFDDATGIMAFDLSNSNVGIGTDSPQATLDVKGASVETTYDLKVNYNDSIYMGLSQSYIDVVGGNDFHFLVAGTEKLTLLNSSAYVHMAGGSDVRLTLGSQGTAGTNDANWIRGNSSTLSFNSASSGYAWEIAGGTKMAMDSSGNVGIGTSSPAETLHIYSTGGVGLKLESDGMNLAIFDIKSDHSSYGNGLAKCIRFSEESTIMASIGVPSAGTHVDDLCFYSLASDGSDTSGNSAGDPMAKLHSGGDWYTNDGSVSSLSDKRGKKDISDLEDGLDIVNELKPVTYKYNGEVWGVDDGVTRYGFVADDILEVASQYVKIQEGTVGDEEVDDLKSISMMRMFPMLVKSVQELSQQNDELKKRIEVLEAK